MGFGFIVKICPFKLQRESSFKTRAILLVTFPKMGILTNQQKIVNSFLRLTIQFLFNIIKELFGK